MAESVPQIDNFIESVVSTHRPVIRAAEGRLHGGNRLWAQFESAVEAYRRDGVGSFSQVTERVNEIVVARIILNDPTLPEGEVLYEPDFGVGPQRIDFVVPNVNGADLCIEVKTVHPTATDSEENWTKYERRRQWHTENTNFVVRKEWMGAALYSNSFAARAHFLDYTLSFEARIASANAARASIGVLVFCGSGFDWRQSDLEDFSDFYRRRRHRADDPFADMEAKYVSDKGIELKRNLAGFSYMKRDPLSVQQEAWTPDVRGPLEFQ